MTLQIALAKTTVRVEVNFGSIAPHMRNFIFGDAKLVTQIISVLVPT